VHPFGAAGADEHNGQAVDSAGVHIIHAHSHVSPMSDTAACSVAAASEPASTGAGKSTERATHLGAREHVSETKERSTLSDAEKLSFVRSLVRKRGAPYLEDLPTLRDIMDTLPNPRACELDVLGTTEDESQGCGAVDAWSGIEQGACSAQVARVAKGVGCGVRVAFCSCASRSTLCGLQPYCRVNPSWLAWCIAAAALLLTTFSYSCFFVDVSHISTILTHDVRR
jgi:hypothetical protein